MQCSGALSSLACEKDFIDPSKRVGIMKCTKTWIGCHYAIDERMVVGGGWPLQLLFTLYIRR